MQLIVRILMQILYPSANLLTVKEIGMEPKPNPDMFPKAPCSISGHGDDVEIPKIAQDDQADYEGELAIVMGKDAKNVSEEDALDYVLGYTAADDVSARYGNVRPVPRSIYADDLLPHLENG
jgi:2-keto-4-pentenoate hydratase/2-oxohepta-3-ene-1,7-dioic acid hydratase in catechol pathway